ncbi:putative nad dependent epimerase dehydratase family protein [Diplodia seriata]|uniref:Putative nad dependent epimerase dehydratase family protein n=1 Tax=Diplodia seriata TaxID=420778 RepID=A0A0G2EMW8_9PEZI|nr:putative nad dependent epimerase dehydratase family protein [Diplodia seriata]
MAPPPRILLTGATGYIGGTILTALLATPTPSFALPITCLIRSPSAAATLTSTYGATRIRPLLYGGLDDHATATAAAAQHADIVINAALGYDAGAALALLRGLAASRDETITTEPWYVHLSGTSNLGDRSVSGAWVEAQRVFDDDDARGVHAWERRVEGLHPLLNSSQFWYVRTST